MRSSGQRILFVAGTHGNEPIGPAVLDRLHVDHRRKFESIIGNPRAVSQQRRFIDADLNRVAPGRLDSSYYEERRAAELIKIFADFTFVIDFHETKANDRIVVIVPRLSTETLILATLFPVRDILIWPGKTTQVNGPLVRYAPCGVEIECGTKTSFLSSLNKLVFVVDAFLKANKENAIIPTMPIVNRLDGKDIYLVGERINPGEVVGVELEDFTPVKKLHGSFTPLLFGRHQGLIGYKMRRLDNNEIVDMI